jgi:hypothetical protein
MQIQEIIIILLICLIVYLLYNKSNNLPNYTPTKSPVEMFQKCEGDNEYDPYICNGIEYSNVCELTKAGENFLDCKKKENFLNI